MIHHNRYNPTRNTCPSTPATQEIDWMSREGAQQLAHDLDHWWHSRGFTTVHHAVVPKQVNRVGSVWLVRSNLVNGLPPKP